MNDAKDYLLQVVSLENQIKRIQWEIDATRERLMLRGVRYDGDRVQTSAGDPLAAVYAKIDSLERRERKLICALKERRLKIIRQINSLPEKYAGLLDYRYVRGLRLEEVAERMGYSYEYVRRMHGEALAEFGRRYNADVSRHKALRAIGRR